ncbi:MAG: WXG100 family type VII secretion target [Clostridia bacterium]
MAYIKVNHSKFETAADAIEDYIAYVTKQMNSATSEVSDLSTNWQGSDFTQFKTQWNTVVNSTSTYYKMKQSYQSYADYLRYAAAQYKSAQTSAVNKASSLPKI